MTPDAHTLRAAAMEADARCNAARKMAEEARELVCFSAAHHSAEVAAMRDMYAEQAQERFFLAMGERDRLRRALAEAEGRVGA